MKIINKKNERYKNVLPVAPSMETALKTINLPPEASNYNLRSVQISLLAILIGIAASLIAQLLTRLIGFITNISFYGIISTHFSSPANNNLGLWVVIVPVVGALIVGLMAKYGSAGIRGHGIPEAMEQILLNESRIQPRLLFLKPISAAISIGTGGPFGAEGPIIATGGALGSLIGQLLKTSAGERKILLASGAAAGMAATFGSPVSAILLSVELLLFEFRPQSLIPVALASTTAAAVRVLFAGTAPIFSLTGIVQPGSAALVIYLLLGGIVGTASVFVTKAVYFIEDSFDKLPVHWMWWPAIGAVAVGIVGYFVPHTMGVGYDNIDNILNGSLFGQALIVLFVMKFVSWAISLGSGTSGGTLAPLFTIGGGLGAILGYLVLMLFPGCGIDVRLSALVGMAAMFAGSARALLASMIFAFETTMQPFGIMPLLAGCSASYLVSGLLMKETIMTEKIARRGVNVPSEYSADFLAQIPVKEYASYKIYSLHEDDTISATRKWLISGSEGSLHHGYPVLDKDEKLAGVISRKEIEDFKDSDSTKLSDVIKGPIAAIFEDHSVSEAADMMAEYGVTRIPVVDKNDTYKVIGIISRSDVLNARRKYIEQKNKYKKYINISLIKNKNAQDRLTGS